jgi:hypothetical protein
MRGGLTSIGWLKSIGLALVVLGWAVTPEALATITLGQIDTFQDGTTMSWEEGLVSPNPPTNEPTGGPAGAGDRFLQNIASGPPLGPGSKQVVFNRDQWAGDYNAEGVDRIDAMMANFGANDLFVRLAIEGNFFQRYGSTSAVLLPASSGWQPVSFDLSAMSLITGTDPLATVLSGVSELRILSVQAAPAWEGDDVASTLGVDNITAAPEPGALALLACGAAMMLRRRRE